MKDSYIPETTCRLSLPNDPLLLKCYETYKVSPKIQALASEQGRTIFAEAFNENNFKLLSEICVKVMAKIFGPIKLPVEIKTDPLKIRLFYDSLSVDLSLEKTHCLNDEQFWKRTLLEISRKKSLQFQKNVNWKSRAITQKLENIIETQQVSDVLPTEEFRVLAQKIKPYITDLHISHLESLPVRHFGQIIKAEDSDFSSSEDEISEDDLPEFSDDSETEESSILSTSSSPIESDLSLSLSQISIQEEIRNMKMDLLVAKNVARYAKDAKYAQYMARQKLRAKRANAKRLAYYESLENQSIIKKNKTKRNYKSLFEIPKQPQEEEKYLDKRNPELLFENHRRLNYSFKQCHHIDLRFLSWFTNLQTLRLEFQGPRHFNFSYKDVRNLAAGMAPLLNLRVFCLRNSRMNAKKLQILLSTLKKMNSVQVLDFGNDALTDDCALIFYLYLRKAQGLLSLELEGNKFRNDFLLKLAYGLYCYEGTKLEYLGLGRNELPHQGFHELMQILCESNNVKELNLTGAHIDESTIVCCIAGNLLRKHKTIEKVNLMAVPLTPQASEAIVTALKTNQKILEFNIRGCDLDYVLEYEIEVILKRNRHISKTPFIGKTDVTEEEIKEFYKNQMHPIYAKVLKKVERQMECMNKQPVSKEKINAKQSPFVFDCNKFDEAQIFKHVHIPGPMERYFYMQKQKRSKHEINIYDI